MTWSSQVTTSLPTGRALPLMAESRSRGNLLEVVGDNIEAMEAALATHGAILFRGFGLSGENALATLFERLWTGPLAYVYRSTPRTNVGKGVYTATEYPASQEIPMHNENAYQRDWPLRIGFHCVVHAEAGGQTPLADVARVTARIDTGLVAEFRERRVTYVRNYSDFIDLPWQTVFQTESKTAVEVFCRENDISFEWIDDGLTTRQVCQGTAVHPGLRNELWFNQAQLFHISSLGLEMAANMIDLFGERKLPRNAYFGDGGAIPESAIAHVTNAFEQEKVLFDWHKDDILILDNMRIAHGRKPFTGSRRVLVSMGYPYSSVFRKATLAADTPAPSKGDM